MLEPSATLVVGVSGGLDSMSLLELARGLPNKIVVAHFNHQLRGAESDGDEEFVRNYAAEHDLEFQSGRGDVRAAAKGVSVEMAARTLRHEFLAGVARECSADILLAHHGDDQIELFIMRLLRGIEGPGLAGMRMVAPSPADSRIRLLRPLLEIGRAELVAFAEENKIPYRHDSSNDELEAERNRIRHKVIPVLRAEGGANFEANLLRHILATREQADLARAAARAWLQSEGDFNQSPEWLRREIVALQLDEAKVPVTAQRLDALVKADGARVSVGAQFSVALDRQGRLQTFGELWPTDALRIDLGEKSEAELENVTISWRAVATASLAPNANQMIFDADRVGTRIVLRHWRQGDRIRLSGRSSERPLHEMFSRNKIARDMRHRLLLATAESGEIFWVEGLRITEEFKITATSKHFLEWRWVRRSL